MAGQLPKDGHLDQKAAAPINTRACNGEILSPLPNAQDGVEEHQNDRHFFHCPAGPQGQPRAQKRDPSPSRRRLIADKKQVDRKSHVERHRNVRHKDRGADDVHRAERRMAAASRPTAAP